MCMRGSVGPIIEGLNVNKFSTIYEGTSVFSTKLYSFIKDEDKATQDFIKKALNTLFVSYKKKYGGYQEGKRPVQRDMGSYKIFTMKFQTNSRTGYNFYNDVAEFFKPLKVLQARVTIDGDEYVAVFKDVDEAVGNGERSASGWAEITSPARNILVGITTQYGAGKQIDKTSEGDTFKVIVSIPVRDAKAFSDNMFASHKGDRWFLSHDPVGDEDWGLEFDEGENKLSIWSRDTNGEGIASADTFHILYKPSRKARDAFFELMNVFGPRTTRAEAESIISKYGVRINHSYWFNPYTD